MPVMRDQQCGALLGSGAEICLPLGGNRAIEARERLIEDQDLGAGGNSPDDGNLA